MKATITSVITALAILCVLAVAWTVIEDTDWYASLSDPEDSSELPSDLTEVFETAVATRADVSDVEQLNGTLTYTDHVSFVHRVEPEISTTTETLGGGRNAQTVSSTVETPGSRAVTDLPEVGDQLAPGDVLYETDSTPVYLAAGAVAAFRTMGDGMTGDDIAQLQAFLIDAGWDTTGSIEPTGVWSAATTTAVELWQTNTGQDITGEVSLGDIWFVEGPIRIVSVESAVGVVAADGDAILSYTSTNRQVETSVEQIPEGLLEAPEILAELPDGATVPAEVLSVRGTETGFDLIFSIAIEGIDVETYDRLPVTLSWTKNEVVDEVTLPPEALKRLDTGGYVVDVLEGDLITRVPVDVIGQAGRIVAVTGVDERAIVLIP